jgi:hypothetical protein
VTGLDGIAVEVMNLVDIQGQSNYELAMRLNTDVQNPSKEFYTDLNGFQVISMCCCSTYCVALLAAFVSKFYRSV